MRPPEVHRAGQHALMPETENLSARALAERERHRALLGNHLEPPCQSDQRKQRPHDARHHRKRNSLARRKSKAGFRGHSDDFSGARGLAALAKKSIREGYGL